MPFSLPLRRVLPAMAALCVVAPLLAGCNDSELDRAVVVSVIGDADQAKSPRAHSRSAAAQMVLAATAQGLVSYDARGEIIPALAQRWIVTDNGLSYIFRLRKTVWANGKRVDARQVARELRQNLDRLAKQRPYGGLDAVDEVRAMTTDILEIRLKRPFPDILYLLADPELAVMQKGVGSGPYRVENRSLYFLLTPVARDITDLEEDADAPSFAPHETRILFAERAAKAVARFSEGKADLVLGGTYADLPLVQAAEIDGESLRIDPTQGVFGIAFIRETPFLKDQANRQALSMALDRPALEQLFRLPGWTPTAALMPPSLSALTPGNEPDWSGQDMAARRTEAQRRIAQWKQDNPDTPARVTLEMDERTGSRLLFHYLSRQWQALGVEVERVKNGGDAVLVDSVAGYDSPIWYLERIGCDVGILCDPEVERMLKAALTETDDAARLTLLAEAEQARRDFTGFIPLARPLRWALVSRRLNGYQPSVRSFHPLDQLLTRK